MIDNHVGDRGWISINGQAVDVLRACEGCAWSYPEVADNDVASFDVNAVALDSDAFAGRRLAGNSEKGRPDIDGCLEINDATDSKDHDTWTRGGDAGTKRARA
jgi:hypothetical protein